MKISRDWLQTYFESELPDSDRLADALTFHAFEIESVENDILDVKITANRGHDCLSHRGIAKELSAILDIPLKMDPLSEQPILGPATDELRVVIDDPALCRRYIGAYIRGAKVGPSPEWLVKRLESIGQKSINNVVDAANFIMFDIGQPLHAFDAGKRTKEDGAYSIRVRLAREGEKLTTLDDKEQQLAPTMLMIADGHSDEPLGVAGVKGGKESGVSDTTTDLILESANFDGPSLRRTARALKFRTDATQRFEQGVSPELAAYGMHAFIQLVQQVAGGELVGVVDEKGALPVQKGVVIKIYDVNVALGTEIPVDEMERIFERLGLKNEFDFDRGNTVTPPFQRLDIAIKEDLIEEVGRIVGYDKVPSIELPVAVPIPPDPEAARLAAIREYLVSQGFSEVFTSVFAEKGERAVSNKIGGDKPYLRSNLQDCPTPNRFSPFACMVSANASPSSFTCDGCASLNGVARRLTSWVMLL
jgi:phenylalanyl-tRNA synthetase beta chain